MNNFLGLKKIFYDYNNIEKLEYIFEIIKKNEPKLYSKKILKNIKKIGSTEPEILNNTDDMGNTILHYAVFYKMYSIISLLLKFHSYLDIKNNLGQTPIFYAILNEDMVAFDILKKETFLLNSQDNLGNTLLHYSIMNRQYEFAHYLISSNASQEIKNNDNKISLFYIVNFNKEKSRNINIFFSKSLLNPTELLDSLNNNIAHYSIIYKNYYLLEELLKYKQFNILFTNKNKNEMNPLSLAANLGDDFAFNLIFSKITEDSFNNNIFNFQDIFKNLNENTILNFIKNPLFPKNFKNINKGFGKEILYLVQNNKTRVIDYILDNFIISNKIEQNVYEDILFYCLKNNDKAMFDKFYLLYKKIKFNSFFYVFKKIIEDLSITNKKNILFFLLNKQRMFLRKEKYNIIKNIDNNKILYFLNFLINTKNEELLIKILDNLLENQIMLKNINKNGYIKYGCILHQTVLLNSITMTKKLLSIGIDSDISNDKGETPLEIAIFNENLDIIKILSYRTKYLDNDRYAFYLIELSISNINIFSYFLDLINIKRNSFYLKKIINLCIKENKVLHIQKLIYKQVFMNNIENTNIIMLDKNFLQNFLFYAIENHKIEIVKILLKNGASVNYISDKQIYNPLQCSIINNSYNIFILLLEKGANPTDLSLSKENCLDIAIRHSRKEMIDILYEKEKGTNSKIQNKNHNENSFLSPFLS